jgi:hypothetical protein
MKFLFIAGLVIMMTSAFAQTPNDVNNMIKVLTDVGIKSWGRSEKIDANITCKLTRENRPTCFIVSNNGSLEFESWIDEEMIDNKALFVSELLKSFGVLPVGKRMRQETYIICFSDKKSGEKKCQANNIDYQSI